MCCFSVATPVGLIARLFAPRLHVSRTSIFARMVAPAVQGLAYGLDLDTRREVAMVLPLPVAVGAGEDAVRFVDLAATPRMFAELARQFDLAQPGARKGGLGRSRAPGPTLVVHRIGAFVASYVPHRADFARLDPRFRLPSVLFEAVPAYADHGFAVFQLVPGKVTVHPMALTFPTRAPTQLFFPTVHVHDGRFHATARFDHALYYQTPRRLAPNSREPPPPLDGDAVAWGAPTAGYAGLVIAEQALARRTLRGKLPNQDTWIAA